MTKREICERLLAIWEMEPYKNTAEAIKHLLLDLAAPEENADLHRIEEDMRRMYEKVAPPPRFDAPEEKKEPPVLIYEETGEKVPCPVCGAPAAPIKNKPGVFLCKRCGGLVCAKEGEK